MKDVGKAFRNIDQIVFKSSMAIMFVLAMYGHFKFIDQVYDTSKEDCSVNNSETSYKNQKCKPD